jgi:hypothetical protein
MKEITMKKLFALSLTVIALGLFAIGCEEATKPAPPATEISAPAADAAAAPAADAAAPAEEPKAEEK